MAKAVTNLPKEILKLNKLLMLKSTCSNCFKCLNTYNKTDKRAFLFYPSSQGTIINSSRNVQCVFSIWLVLVFYVSVCAWRARWKI